MEIGGLVVGRVLLCFRMARGRVEGGGEASCTAGKAYEWGRQDWILITAGRVWRRLQWTWLATPWNDKGTSYFLKTNGAGEDDGDSHRFALEKAHSSS